MYFSLFMLSWNKMNCNRDCELAHHTWKMSPHYLVKCRTHSSDGRYTVPPKSKHWWLWKGELCCVALVAVKRADCVEWQLECQASNVTVSGQYHFPFFFCHWSIALSTTLGWKIATVLTRCCCLKSSMSWTGTCYYMLLHHVPDAIMNRV